MSISMNQLQVLGHHAQGTYKRVLCVCAAGCLRSPTAAEVLAREPFNFNTRSAGVDTAYAIVPVTEVLLAWADEIVCMKLRHKDAILDMDPEMKKPIVVLDIPDNYEFRDNELQALIANRYQKRRPD